MSDELKRENGTGEHTDDALKNAGSLPESEELMNGTEHKTENKTENETEHKPENKTEDEAENKTENKPQNGNAEQDGNAEKEAKSAEKEKLKEQRRAERRAERAAAKADPARKKRLRNGSYAAAVTAIVIVAVLLVNFIVQAIPEKFTQSDLSSQKLYSIGDTTKNLLNSLDKDVTLYFVTQSGGEDEAVQKLVDNYAASSDHVKAVTIDAVENPTFTQQYTEDTVTLNSVIAVSGEKSKVADYNTFYSYDSYYSSSASSFDAEGQITSAIASVALDAGAKIYYTTGHNEIAIGSEMSDAMSKANIDSEELNLLTSDIPDDCTALLIFSPMTDFTEDEANKVITYLQNGGHALIVSISEALISSEMPNFDSIMTSYGVTRKGGLVLEGDANSYVQIPYLIIPTVQTTDSTSGLGNTNILDALPEALEVSEDEDAAYTVQTVLTTSSSAYNKTNLETTLEKEDGDEEGTFALGVQVEETLSQDDQGSSDVDSSSTDSTADSTAAGDTDDGTDSDSTKETKILYFTSPALFSSATLSTLIQSNASLPEGNTQLFSQALTYLTDQTVTVSVDAKDLSIPQTTIASGTVNGLGTVFMFVIPAAVLVAGFVIWGRRRRQ